MHEQVCHQALYKSLALLIYFSTRSSSYSNSSFLFLIYKLLPVIVIGIRAYSASIYTDKQYSVYLPFIQQFACLKDSSLIKVFPSLVVNEASSNSTFSRTRPYLDRAYLLTARVNDGAFNHISLLKCFRRFKQMTAATLDYFEHLYFVRSSLCLNSSFKELDAEVVKYKSNTKFLPTLHCQSSEGKDFTVIRKSVHYQCNVTIKAVIMITVIKLASAFVLGNQLQLSFFTILSTVVLIHYFLLSFSAVAYIRSYSIT